MQEKKKPLSWREMLRGIIADVQERQRIASELDINPATLIRWSTNETNPRPQNLRHLLEVLPKYRETLLPLIQEELPSFNMNDGSFPGATGEGRADVIPGEFYIRVLRTRATTPKVIRYSTLGNLILEQALKHLDPDRVGVGISIARCLPPSRGDNVSSLLVDLGRGSPPWAQSMVSETMLLGAESMAGYAAAYARPVAIADLYREDTTIPASVGAWEKSAVAMPIMFEGNIAGSLLVSCTQTNYFAPEQVQLISNYADLVALAFEPEQFYETSRIQLRMFPNQQEQQPAIRSFRARVSEILHAKQPISIAQAEHQAWQQIEEELLDMPLTKANQKEY